MHYRIVGLLAAITIACATTALVSAGCSDDANINPVPVPHDGGADAPASDAPADSPPAQDAAPDTSVPPDAPAEGSSDAAAG
jgi:hypothetical protein